MTTLVTGGCGLIGEAFVRALAERGDQVIILDINDDAGHNLAKDINPCRVKYYHCDVTRSEELKDLFRFIRSQLGTIDAVVHSAYPRPSSWGTPFEDLCQEDMAKHLILQLGSAITVSQQAIKHFRSQGKGHLIHISSIQGVAAPKFDHYEGTTMTSPIEYTAIKRGVIGITHYLAKYLSGTGIRVNCISPGGIRDGQPPSFLKRYQSDCTSKGMLDPKDLTGALLFLLSKESACINGHNLIVDDGWSL